MRRLVDKIRKNAEQIMRLEEDQTENADVIVVSYGISSRVALKAIADARKKGIKVGTLRLVTVWPFPERRVRELAPKVKAFVVPEINYGQVVLEVERCVGGDTNVVLVPHGGGWVHNPDDILNSIERVVREKGRRKGVIEYRKE